MFGSRLFVDRDPDFFFTRVLGTDFFFLIFLLLRVSQTSCDFVYILKFFLKRKVVSRNHVTADFSPTPLCRILVKMSYLWTQRAEHQEYTSPHRPFISSKKRKHTVRGRKGSPWGGGLAPPP